MQNTSFLLALVLSLDLAMQGCASQSPAYNPEDSGGPPIMTSEQARKMLKHIARRVNWIQVMEPGQKNELNLRSPRYVDIRFQPDGVHLNYTDEETGSPIQCWADTQVEHLQTISTHDAYYVSTGNCQLYWRDYTGGLLARDFVDALFTLRVGQGVDEQALQEFHPIALVYRAQHPKPWLSTSARGYRDQAIAANQEERIDVAIDAYEQALLTDPWYPDGHYNRALLLAQEGWYGAAVTEMKKYLDLVPDSTDAGTAEKRIESWTTKKSILQK